MVPAGNTSTALDRAATFANSEDLVLPMAAAIERAAIDIMSEPPTGDSHQMRTDLARLALADPKGLVPRFAWAVSANDTIVDKFAAGDRAGAIADFQFAVNSVWDAVAGYVPGSAPAPAPAAR